MTEAETPAPSKKRPSGLGRGLSALLGEISVEAPVSLTGETPKDVPQGVKMVPIAHLRPMPNQPRKNFDDAALDELADSIRSRGLLQPIVVRESRGEGFWQIVAGERRWRAAQRAGLHQVPILVREFDDITALELAIIENVQREGLNAWEEGNAYAQLVSHHGYSQEELGKIVGKSRSHVANLMRLQNLPIRVHGWLSSGQLTMGHARALLTCEDPEGLAQQIMTKDLSVRQTEALVRKLTSPAAKPRKLNQPSVADADLAALERQLSDLLGISVNIKYQAGKGDVILTYTSLEQLDMICQRLSGERI